MSLKDVKTQQEKGRPVEAHFPPGEGGGLQLPQDRPAHSLHLPLFLYTCVSN